MKSLIFALGVLIAYCQGKAIMELPLENPRPIQQNINDLRARCETKCPIGTTCTETLNSLSNLINVVEYKLECFNSIGHRLGYHIETFEHQYDGFVAHMNMNMKLNEPVQQLPSQDFDSDEVTVVTPNTIVV